MGKLQEETEKSQEKAPNRFLASGKKNVSLFTVFAPLYILDVVVIFKD